MMEARPSLFPSEKNVPAKLSCMHCHSVDVLLQLLYFDDPRTIYPTTLLHMRASMFLVLFSMPPSLENVAVIVVMVMLVLVASHTCSVMLVH